MYTDSSLIAQIAIGIVVGLAGVSLGLKKLLKGWKETSAESSLISIMHVEIERMAAQNSLLASELNKLQLEIITLTRELHNLTVENQKLNTEISQLREQIVTLKTLLPESRGI